jgi:hypothetical protein
VELRIAGLDGNMKPCLVEIGMGFPVLPLIRDTKPGIMTGGSLGCFEAAVLNDKNTRLKVA